MGKKKQTTFQPLCQHPVEIKFFNTGTEDSRIDSALLWPSFITRYVKARVQIEVQLTKKKKNKEGNENTFHKYINIKIS